MNTCKIVLSIEYDRHLDILTGQPKSAYIPIIEPVEFTLNTSANNITSKAITNAEQPISNGIIINKWIAGTINAFNISEISNNDPIQ